MTRGTEKIGQGEGDEVMSNNNNSNNNNNNNNNSGLLTAFSLKKWLYTLLIKYKIYSIYSARKKNTLLNQEQKCA